MLVVDQNKTSAESNLSEIPSEPWNGCDRLFIRDRAVTAAGMRWQVSLRRRKTEEREKEHG